MKKGKIAFEDIAQHIPQDWKSECRWFEVSRDELVEELKRRINKINRTSSPKNINARSKDMQTIYSLLKSLSYEEVEQVKELPGLIAVASRSGRDYRHSELTKIVYGFPQYENSVYTVSRTGGRIDSLDISEAKRLMIRDYNEHLYKDLL